MKGGWRWVRPIEVLSIHLTNSFVYSINRSEIGGDREREREREQLGKSMMGWLAGWLLTIEEGMNVWFT
jgi:hypothetical protein